jgi:hypothetical protein
MRVFRSRPTKWLARSARSLKCCSGEPSPRRSPLRSSASRAPCGRCGRAGGVARRARVRRNRGLRRIEQRRASGPRCDARAARCVGAGHQSPVDHRRGIARAAVPWWPLRGAAAPPPANAGTPDAGAAARPADACVLRARTLEHRRPPLEEGAHARGACARLPGRLPFLGLASRHGRDTGRRAARVRRRRG